MWFHSCYLSKNLHEEPRLNEWHGVAQIAIDFSVVIIVVHPGSTVQQFLNAPVTKLSFHNDMEPWGFQELEMVLVSSHKNILMLFFFQPLT